MGHLGEWWLVAARAHLEQGSPSMMPRSTARMRCSMRTRPQCSQPAMGVDPVDARLSRPGAAEHPRGSHSPASWLTPQPGYGLCAGWQRSSNLARRNTQPERAEACAALAGERGFAPESAQAIYPRGWAFVERGRGTEEIVRYSRVCGGLPGHGISTETVVLSCPAHRACGKWGRSRKG